MIKLVPFSNVYFGINIVNLYKFNNSIFLFVIIFLLNCVQVRAIELPNSFADLVEKLSPAVVNITTTAVLPEREQFNPTVPRGSPFEDFFRDFMERQPGDQQPKRQRRGTALGSGFIISSDGLLVTNNHVIENADEIKIEMLDGEILEAKVLGTDPKTDIALLKVESNLELPFVKFGNSDQARVGDWVLAIGNPLGQGFSVSAGIISARGRDLQGPYDDFIQTDAAINRGNSGGPLFNTNGEVIGVNTAILSPNGGSIGIGFSMSSVVVNKVVDQLRDFGETRRGWLGVRIQNLNSEVAEALGLENIDGALVTDVPDGPAKDAGIKSGDVIIEFDGFIINDSSSLVKVVGDSDVGKDAEVLIWRDGIKITIIVKLGRLETVQLADKKSQNSTNKINEYSGMSFTELNDEIRKRFDLPEDTFGVIIVGLNDNSPAAERGIKVGDIIQKVDQVDITTSNEILNLIEDAKKREKSSMLFLIKRGLNVRFIAIPIE
ncbi:MAG: Do family serine endopeptidase [Paracoccaceae bacterium]